MKTAVQEVFSDLEKLHPNLFNVYTTEGKFFINHFHKYLEMEKEQIAQSFEDGEYNYFYSKEDGKNFENGFEYYNEKFKQQKQ